LRFQNKRIDFPDEVFLRPSPLQNQWRIIQQNAQAFLYLNGMALVMPIAAFC